MSDAADSLDALCAAHGPVNGDGRFAVGTVFGDWRLTAFIGRGGSGEVYCAEHVMLGTSAAVKVLVRDDARAKERFAREAKLLSELKSTSFPQFFAYGESNGYTYLAMELLEPGDLPTHDREVACFLLCICDAVAELHARGIVHRDIKPGNILWRRAGVCAPCHTEACGACRHATAAVPVLADLGLAKRIATANEAHAETLTIIDGKRAGVGTPGYGAPEQMERGEATAASDIHALGVLADHCFGGKPSRTWARIIRRATSSMPAYRYSSVAAFARAIRWRHLILCAITLAVSFSLAMVISNIEFSEEVTLDPPRKTHEYSQRMVVLPKVVQPERGHQAANTSVRAEKNETGQGVHDADIEKRRALVAAAEEEKRTAAFLRQMEEQRKAMQREAQEQINRALKDPKYIERLIGPTNMPVVSVRRLEGKTVVLPEPVVLEGGKEYQVYGPGILYADLFCPTTAVVRLKDCLVMNRTKKLYPENGIYYKLDNGVYLNFINVKKRPRDLNLRDFMNMYDGAFNEVRFGGPETLQELEELRAAENSALMEAPSRSQSRSWR